MAGTTMQDRLLLKFKEVADTYKIVFVHEEGISRYGGSAGRIFFQTEDFETLAELGYDFQLTYVKLTWGDSSKHPAKYYTLRYNDGQNIRLFLAKLNDAIEEAYNKYLQASQAQTQAQTQSQEK